MGNNYCGVPTLSARNRDNLNFQEDQIESKKTFGDVF